MRIAHFVFSVANFTIASPPATAKWPEKKWIKQNIEWNMVLCHWMRPPDFDCMTHLCTFLSALGFSHKKILHFWPSKPQGNKEINEIGWLLHRSPTYRSQSKKIFFFFVRFGFSPFGGDCVCWYLWNCERHQSVHLSVDWFYPMAATNRQSSSSGKSFCRSSKHKIITCALDIY